jgi:hypothetical protein
MNNTVRIALAAAAVVVVALIGYQLLVAPNVGGPPPSPSPSAEPSEAPSEVPSTSGILTLEPEMGALFAGTYVITNVEPYTITITIPDGWESLEVPAQIWGPGDPKSAVGWYTVDDLFADPCDAAAGYLGVGPTVNDLVEALSTYPGLTVEQTTEATVSGFAGVSVELAETRPDCGGTEPLLLRSQPGGVDRPFGSADELIVLDVAGDRLVISQGVGAGAPPDTAEAIQSIIDSTVIEAP